MLLVVYELQQFRKPPEKREMELKLKLMEKRGIRVRRGKVIVIKDRCKGCGFCIENCPSGVLKQSEDINVKGYHYPIVVEEPPFKVCINCSFCSLICPEFAIFSIPIEEVEEE